jgi:hypothetical protein
VQKVDSCHCYGCQQKYLSQSTNALASELTDEKRARSEIPQNDQPADAPVSDRPRNSAIAKEPDDQAEVDGNANQNRPDYDGTAKAELQPAAHGYLAGEKTQSKKCEDITQV